IRHLYYPPVIPPRRSAAAPVASCAPLWMLGGLKRKHAVSNRLRLSGLSHSSPASPAPAPRLLRGLVDRNRHCPLQPVRLSDATVADADRFVVAMKVAAQELRASDWPQSTRRSRKSFADLIKHDYPGHQRCHGGRTHPNRARYDEKQSSNGAR